MVSSRGLSTCRTCHEGLAFDFHVNCTACEAGYIIDHRSTIETSPSSSRRASSSSPHESSSPSASNSVYSRNSSVLPDSTSHALENRLPPIQTIETTYVLPPPTIQIPSIFSVYKEAIWPMSQSHASTTTLVMRKHSSSSSSKDRRALAQEPKVKLPHNNTPYSEEQTHFITYQKNLKTMKTSSQRWHTIASLFVARWPGRRRTSDAMSSVFYRDQLIPRLNSRGKIIYDRNDKAIMKKYNVRLQDKTIEGCRFREYFEFLTRNPEEALTYDWVSPAEKEQARRLIASRGGLRLPGSIDADRAPSDDRPIRDKMCDRRAQDMKKDEKEVLSEQALEYRRVNGCRHHLHDDGQEEVPTKGNRCFYCARYAYQNEAEIRTFQSREWQKRNALPHRSDVQESDIAPEYEDSWSLIDMMREHAAHELSVQDSRKAIF